MNKYILFVYTHYIQENWDDYTKFGKIVIYPAWIIRSIFTWIFSFVGFPFVLAHMRLDKMDILKMLSEMK